jgi:hypothetical protein
MALQWSTPVNTKPKPKRPPLHIPPPRFSKHDLVFVLDIHGGNTNSSSNLFEVVNSGFRLQQRQYVYFCKSIDLPQSPDTTSTTTTTILCKAEHLRKPKYRTGTKLRVRDLDDRIHGFGIISDWKVRIECLEFVNNRFLYWIKIPGTGGKKGSLLLDVEESELEAMAVAAASLPTRTRRGKPERRKMEKKKGKDKVKA